MPVDNLFEGLKALTQAAFPRKCRNCGRVFESMEIFLGETESISNLSGLKAAEDDDGGEIVELFRNCVCGSTLLELCRDRRDNSEQGAQLRDKFGVLLVELMSRGLSREVARAELLKLVNGQRSELLTRLINKNPS
jgi:hypothetical protein